MPAVTPTVTERPWEKRKEEEEEKTTEFADYTLRLEGQAGSLWSGYTMQQDSRVTRFATESHRQ